MTSDNRKFILVYDSTSDHYILKSGKIRLESDSEDQFSIRKNELERWSLKYLPVGIKFILQDETLHKRKELVCVKIILEKIGTGEFSITVEESSQNSRWENSALMELYFSEVCEYLKKRQRNAFDVIVETTMIEEYYFLIQYKILFRGCDQFLLLKMCRTITREVHNLSEQINNGEITGSEV